jgi:hypothetical protein
MASPPSEGEAQRRIWKLAGAVAWAMVSAGVGGMSRNPHVGASGRFWPARGKDHPADGVERVLRGHDDLAPGRW